MGETELFLLKEVFTKVKYDSLEEKWIIYLEDYIHLNLTPTKMQILIKMCTDYGIELEQLPEKISKPEAKKLFKEYEELKRKYALSKEKEKAQIEKQLILLKNKIVEGFMYSAYKIITNQIPNIKESHQKEDIYQAGYEALIRCIDSYKSDIDVDFIGYLYHYLISHMKFPSEPLKASLEELEYLTKMIQTREKYFQEEGRIPSDKELSKLINLDVKTIEKLLILENRLKTESSDKLSDDDYPIDYSDSTLEESFRNISREQLIKMLELLDPLPKEVVMLYHGLEDGVTYNFPEIATKLGISPARASQLHKASIEKLHHPIYLKYIKSIVDDDYPEQGIKLHSNAKHTIPINGVTPHSYTELEENLIENLPFNKLLKYIAKLSPKEKQFITLYFGINLPKKHSIKEIMKVMNITNPHHIDHIRKRTFKNIKYQIIREYYRNAISDEEIDNITRHDYIDYLMSMHLNNHQKR